MKANGKNSNMSKRYTEDFKKQIVELINKGGKTQKERAEDMGIDRRLMSAWSREYDKENSRWHRTHA